MKDRDVSLFPEFYMHYIAFVVRKFRGRKVSASVITIQIAQMEFTGIRGCC
jgi:hypothetical protein